MPAASALRSVEDVSDTLTNRLPRAGMPALPALLLAILGNVMVIVLLAVSALLVVGAGVVVFWPAIESLL